MVFFVTRDGESNPFPTGVNGLIQGLDFINQFYDLLYTDSSIDIPIDTQNTFRLTSDFVKNAEFVWMQGKPFAEVWVNIKPDDQQSILQGLQAFGANTFLQQLVNENLVSL